MAGNPHIGLLDLVDGDLFFTAPDGSLWGPLACGEHRPERPDGVATPPRGQLGFKRTHEPCIQTVLQLIEHYNHVQDMTP
jgi:hypothetical protein